MRIRPSRSDLREAAASNRLDLPVYLDAGVALSLSASLSHGVATERSVERAVSNEMEANARGKAGLPPLGVTAELRSARGIAITENEVRQHTLESIFNDVRRTLEQRELVRAPASPWVLGDWQLGEFVDFKTGRMVVPLVSVLSRIRLMSEAFAFATKELSPDRLRERIPQLLDRLRADDDEEATAAGTTSSTPKGVDAALDMLTEVGEAATTIAGLMRRLEEEAEESGLIDVVMFEGRSEEPALVATASLNRDYVDKRLLRRLSQGHFGVLGKVLREPETGTAFNAFRNSMLGATNQFPVLLTKYADLLFELPLLLGDSVHLDDELGGLTLLDFVGSGSAISELRPLWTLPSVEIFPVAIYA